MVRVSDSFTFWNDTDIKGGRGSFGGVGFAIWFQGGEKEIGIVTRIVRGGGGCKGLASMRI